MSFKDDFPDGAMVETFAWYGIPVSKEEWLRRMAAVIDARPYKDSPHYMNHNYSGDVTLVPLEPPTLCQRVASLIKPKSPQDRIAEAYAPYRDKGTAPAVEP